MQIMQRAASNIRTEANVLKDTVDGDGVADLAAQSAAERPIGDLTNAELRARFALVLDELYSWLDAAAAMMLDGRFIDGVEHLRKATELLRQWRREVRP